MKFILAFFGGFRNHFYDLLITVATLLLVLCTLYGKALGFLIGFMVFVMVLLLRKLHQLYGISSYQALLVKQQQEKAGHYTP